jgi:SET domain-containing protein
MYCATEIRESTIFGKGLFATEPIKRGKIICFFPIGAQVITEERFLQAVVSEERAIVRTGTRFAGKYFTVGNEDQPYTFLNHSFTPNLLCHCGIVLARRDIAVGEELTLDYRTLIDDTDIGIYSDAASGQEIRGFSARQTLLQTASELADIIKDIPDWQG